MDQIHLSFFIFVESACMAVVELDALCVPFKIAGVIVCVTHGVVDSSRFQGSSSSWRSSSRSEDNTGTSRSPSTRGTRHCPGLQIPQTPTLENRHTKVLLLLHLYKGWEDSDFIIAMISYENLIFWSFVRSLLLVMVGKMFKATRNSKKSWRRLC